ncbi:hypothetical protein A142_11430 [Vibrio splendidus 12E03]|uniref:Uncharacterized protein n=1 Tax=Vibrio splendidus 12E03 TaxID=1191305 RepID=A0A1E5FBX2_VIBSP|nr:hypothetical protein A142_11430 [Vibrio splendidus 12E03]
MMGGATVRKCAVNENYDNTESDRVAGYYTATFLKLLGGGVMESFSLLVEYSCKKKPQPV